MSKLICYSLFNAPCEPFEMAAYVRGFYMNCRMNNLIYPDWRTHLEIDRATYARYPALFDWLVANNNLSMSINEVTPPLCEGMLWRMKPIFTIDVTHILCRDADALTTYREARAVQTWLESGMPFHAINDNPSHGGLMGGMVGFDCARLKALGGWNSWDEMIATAGDLSQRGSDQYFLNKLPITKGVNLLLHDFRHVVKMVANVPGVDPHLWESDLTCRHIGSAGVVDMEVLRFFQRFDPQMWNSKTGATGKYMAIEKQYKELMYWWL